MKDLSPIRRNPAAPVAEPLSRAEAAALLGCLDAYPAVHLAVSGGSDSMALMLLVACWLEDRRGGRAPRVEVVTVDHGLRAQSADEARWVGERARALGLAHATLAWTGDKPASAIQEAARAARYGLLMAHARAVVRKPVAIVTAHTEDDQAETLLMRLARGSGVDGLAAMAARRTLSDDPAIELVRPLLGVTKARLVATLEAAGLAWIDDPSNDSLDFERVRLRAARRELTEVGLASDKLALSARRLLRAREALDAATDALCASAVDTHAGIYASIAMREFQAAPAELRVRLLARLLEAYGGEAKAPRLMQVEALAEALSAPREGQERVALTLGGCIISAGARAIRLLREPRDLPALTLAPGSSAVWDGRFRVSLAAAKELRAAGVTPPVVVRALGASAYATLRPGHERERPPARAAAGLPSFWAGDELIAVPHLGGVRSLRSRLCAAEFMGLRQCGPGNGVPAPDEARGD